MKIKRLLSLALAATAAAGISVLAACGGADSNGSASRGSDTEQSVSAETSADQNASTDVAGKTYSFYALTFDEEAFAAGGRDLPSAEEISVMEDSLSDCCIVFNEDGTFTLKYCTDLQSCSIEDETGYYYYVTDENGEECIGLCETQDDHPENYQDSEYGYYVILSRDGDALYYELWYAVCQDGNTSLYGMLCFKA